MVAVWTRALAMLAMAAQAIPAVRGDVSIRVRATECQEDPYECANQLQAAVIACGGVKGCSVVLDANEGA
jgi:hypothetical protein